MSPYYAEGMRIPVRRPHLEGDPEYSRKKSFAGEGVRQCKHPQAELDRMTDDERKAVWREYRQVRQKDTENGIE